MESIIWTESFFKCGCKLWVKYPIKTYDNQEKKCLSTKSRGQSHELGEAKLESECKIRA